MGPLSQLLLGRGVKNPTEFLLMSGRAWSRAREESCKGFAIAGEDRKFRWADAVIEGDSVVVSNDKINAPVAVRYAWSAAPAWANLLSKDRSARPDFPDR